MWRTLLAALIALPLAVPAAADAPPDPAALAMAVDGAVDRMIAPAYRSFAEAATTARVRIDALCAAPSAEALAAARDGFAGAVVAFAAIEPFRFGPARRDNGFERLFFWPDRRSRGFRQVVDVIRTEDETATDPVSLEAKSVAVQGLPALDYVLAGRGSEALETAPAGFRCAYAKALGARIETVAAVLSAEWSGPFGGVVRAAGPENPVYRSHAEALQALLGAAREQLTVVADLKVGGVLGEGDERARPEAAPFAQSGLGLAETRANVEAVRALVAAMDLAKALPEDQTGLANEIDFQIGHGLTALRDAERIGGDWAGVAASPEARDRAAYGALALGYAIDILQGRLPAALGMIAGFNALDGD